MADEAGEGPVGADCEVRLGQAALLEPEGARIVRHGTDLVHGDVGGVGGVLEGEARRDAIEGGDAGRSRRAGPHGCRAGTRFVPLSNRRR